MPSDHLYSEVFRALPDLVCLGHHPDGVIWPLHQPGGTETLPVVILEVQMHAGRRFHRRLGEETFRLLQQHEEVEHLRVLVLLSASPATLSPRYPRPSALPGDQALLIGGHHHQLKGR